MADKLSLIDAEIRACRSKMIELGGEIENTPLRSSVQLLNPGPLPSGKKIITEAGLGQILRSTKTALPTSHRVALGVSRPFIGPYRGLEGTKVERGSWQKYTDDDTELRLDDVIETAIKYHLNGKNYHPTFYESPALETADYADPQQTLNVQFNMQDGPVNRVSFHGPYELRRSIIINGNEVQGLYPVNPVGKTGIIGRGMLGKWGPNHAADPIVVKEENGSIFVVCIKRKDTGEWGLPGGMVEPGHDVSRTIMKEFMEEAMRSLEESDEKNQETEKFIGDIFKRGKYVYRGYVDDPRNTDNSWMETVAVVIKLTKNEASKIKLQAGDDAEKVRWVKYSDQLKLYASHNDLLKRAIALEFNR